MSKDNVSYEFFSRKNFKRITKVYYEKKYDSYIEDLDPTGELGLAELELPYDELEALYLECTLPKEEAERNE